MGRIACAPALLVALSCRGATISAPDSRAPGGDCWPAPPAPLWLEEGRALDAQAVCTGRPARPDDRFAVLELPPGAHFDEATATLSWTPGLDQAAVYQLRLVNVATGDETAWAIGVADAWDHPGNLPVQDPLRYPQELALPVLFLDPAPQEEEYRPAAIVYRGRRYQVEAKLRGATSLEYPKNSYTIEFPGDDRFSDPDRGFTGRRKIVLTSTFDDGSQLRQRLGYTLWNRLDPQQIQVQTFHVVVYLGGSYWGLYLLGDHVDRHLLAAQGLAATGNLYKAINHDANFRRTDDDGEPKTTLHQGFEKKEGSPPAGEPGAFADLDALVAFVADSSDAEFLAGLPQRIARRDYENWWIFAVFTMAGDSAGKNSYHHADPVSGQFRVVPWDLNQSFGQDWQTRLEPAEQDTEYRDENHLFERFLGIPALAGPLRQRMGEVLDRVYARDQVLGMLDAMAREIAAAAARDERRWGAMRRAHFAGFRDQFADPHQEVAYVRDWLAARWAYLAGR
jgi:spore coat protein CotH